MCVAWNPELDDREPEDDEDATADGAEDGAGDAEDVVPSLLPEPVQSVLKVRSRSAYRSTV